MAYYKNNDRCIFKFNGGNGAILCSNCLKIVKTGCSQTEDNTPNFCCKECEEEWFKTKKS